MTNLLTWVVAATLTQPAPPQPSTQVAQLEAQAASGQAQCADYQQLARLYRDRGDFDLGLTTVRTCVTLAPDDPRAYHAVADYLSEEANALRARAQSLARDGVVPIAATPLDCRSPRPGLPAGPAPVRVGGNVKPPAKIKHVNPAYPPIASQARLQGVVILEVTVGASGKVEAACVAAVDSVARSGGR